jgi:DNA-directed RNA polymerase II subunit RPB4
MDEERDVGESTAPRAAPRVRKPKDVAPKISRPRPPKAGVEEAGVDLRLGEFQDVDTLTLSEANLVINAILEKRKEMKRNVNETE